MPVRARDLLRALAQFGVEAQPPRGGGSHWKLYNRSGVAFILPCHNGERSEVSDRYLRALCRELAIDLQELKRLL